ncbi:TPA: hypothetical protein ACHYPN_003649 [Yersinia enterocolitica]|uniref:hypothetical protein n=1 Tax=Gammaproteobacteria TaxID=1236 RepID=UPI0003B1029B|nr:MULTISPECIES: hypothetical protein [Gammaproteobacteria]
MAVIYYGEGTHDAGFVGFRVARTVGVADDYRQEYFSLREYSYATAHRLAYSLDRKWEAEAEEVKRQNKTCKRRRNSGPNIIADGLRAYIGIENRSRMGGKRTYFTPCFLVTKPGYGNGDIAFRVSTHGYNEAYEKAVETYCEIHNLTDEQYVELLDRMPSKEVFTGYLLDALLMRGHRATKAEILSKLGSVENEGLSPMAKGKTARTEFVAQSIGGRNNQATSYLVEKNMNLYK